MIRITIDKNDAGQRLDRFLRKYLKNAPLSTVYKIIRKDVKVNGRRMHKEDSLQEGDELFLYLSEEDLKKYTTAGEPRRSPKRTFQNIYEDDSVLIVSKPAGLLVHGDSREKKDTLVNQVTDYLIRSGAYVPRVEKTFSPAAANRLDRNTSGLVVFGKDAPSLRTLAAMFREKGSVDKRYLTVVRGRMKEPLHLRGTLKKDQRSNRSAVRLDGSGAIGSGINGASDEKAVETKVRPLFSSASATLAEVQLITGRTHQIRAHLSAAGYPIAGDPKYGDPEWNRMLAQKCGLKRQFLHAYRLSMVHAGDALQHLEGRTFQSPLPGPLAEAADRLLGRDWRRAVDHHKTR